MTMASREVDAVEASPSNLKDGGEQEQAPAQPTPRPKSWPKPLDSWVNNRPTTMPEAEYDERPIRFWISNLIGAV